MGRPAGRRGWAENLGREEITGDGGTHTGKILHSRHDLVQ